MSKATSSSTQKATILLGGIRAGQVTEFCKMMGWSVRPYQMIFMLLWSYRRRLQPIIPPRYTYEQWFERHWRKSKPEHGWTKVIFDEHTYAPKCLLASPPPGSV